MRQRAQRLCGGGELPGWRERPILTRQRFGKGREMMTAETGKVGLVAIWGLRVLVAALFLLAAVMKLSGQPMMVAEFDMVGLGQWFRIFTGLVELAGAVLLLIPAFSVIGAVILLGVDAGAFVAQLTAIHMDVVHTFVIAAVIAVLIYLQRGQLRALLGK